ncbi:DUF5995 family protein [Pedococcus sp. KACC 23699]|uniref:DUF5995 family protein n=1 Tax=Pedococcus sp. KACC 23699 TaxID=3149228 RepID=A0AAU7JRT0_9MICO
MGFLGDVANAARRGVTQALGAITSMAANLNDRRALTPSDPPPDQPTSIAQVIEELRLLGAAMPTEDGVADFHRMYLHVTELIGAAAAARSFQDAAFMERLDCVFAGLYLDACRATDESRSSAWQPLFALRAQPGTARLQHALAGMNAHINFDLGLALVRTCRQLGRTLDSPGVRADFLAVNEILAAAVQEVRESYLAGVALQLDRAAAPELDVVGGWSIEAARDAAWLSATVQWALQSRKDAYAAYLGSRASLVGLVTRQLLTPVSFPELGPVPGAGA